jgi:hypothetical protein
VPEYDAFGREIGEDTLSGLGGSDAESKAGPEPASQWTSEQLAQAAARPAPEPVIAPPPQPAPQPFQAQPQPQPQPQAPRIQSPSFNVPVGSLPTVRRRRGGVGCLIGLVILAAVIAGPVIAVVSLVDDASDTIDKVTGTIDGLDPAAPDDPGKPVKPPTGIAGRSLIAPRNFDRAVRRIEDAGIGRIALLRLAPERLDVQVAKGSRQRSVQVTFDGDFTRAPATAGGTSMPTLAYSDIEPRAPARLVRASRRYGVRPKGINYLVLSNLPGIGLRWVAYFKNGVYVAGDRNGRNPQKISG